MKRLVTIIVMISVATACGDKDNNNQDQDQPAAPDTSTKVEIVTGFIEAPDGNSYEELRINDRRCIIGQHYDDQTPSVNCNWNQTDSPPTTTATTLYPYYG